MHFSGYNKIGMCVLSESMDVIVMDPGSLFNIGLVKVMFDDSLEMY